MNIYKINQKEFTQNTKTCCPVKKLVHDIRSPLQTLSIIASGHFDDDLRKQDIVQQCMRRINGLCQSKTESSATINIPNMIRTLRHQKLIEHQIELRTQLSLTSPILSLKINEGLLIETISNLINNSVDSKNCSLVRLKIKQHNEQLLISIIDNGQGIQDQHLHKIGTYGVTYKKKGSGIGLASCISKISKAQGKLSCSTILDHGTKMTISLPIQKT